MNRQPDPRQIQTLAYQIWESRGRPDGQSEQHWREAEQRLETSDGDMLDDEAVEAAGDRAHSPGQEQDTPGRAKSSSSRQQTQPNQGTQTGSPAVDEKSAKKNGSLR